MARAEVGGTLDFVDIITNDPFQYAYMSKRGNDNDHQPKERIMDVWISQMQQKQDFQRSSKRQMIADERAYLSVLQQNEDRETVTQ